jgi:phage terminase Nu1 subunit (DNA packaging protein)
MKYRTLKVSEVAQLFKVKERWINRLSKEKGFPKKGKGKYELVACVHWYMDYIRQIERAPKRNNDSLQRSEERKARAQVDILEYKVGQLRQELLPVDQVVHIIEPFLGAIKQKLLGIPKAAAREFNSKDLETFLDGFIRKSLTELATLDNFEWGGVSAEKQAEDIDRLIHEAGTEADHKPVGGPVPKAERRGKRRKRPMGHGPG